MAGGGQKRKRYRRLEVESRKKAKMEMIDSPSLRTIEHPTLRRYYPQISTLRTHLLSTLPPSAKSRRRKIETAGSSNAKSSESRQRTLGQSAVTAPFSRGPPRELDGEDENSQRRLAELLDNTLIGTPAGSIPLFKDSREKDFQAFSQMADVSLASTLDGGTTSIADVSISGSALENHSASTLSRVFALK